MVLPASHGEGRSGCSPLSSFTVYVSFSTSNLYNWKTQNPPFSEKLQALTNLFSIQAADWGECWQLQDNMLTAERRDAIQLDSRKLALGLGSRTLPDTWIE